MMLKILTILVAISTVRVLGTCDHSKCPQAPKHYEELGCKPIIKEGECCPQSFDCKHLNDRVDRKCYYKGKIIESGETVDDILLTASCIGSSHCSAGKFIFAHNDCAEFFGPPLQEGCIRQYSRDKCCSIGSVCGDEAKKLATCEFEGKTYREGERMYPVDHKCHKCYCTSDFSNATIVDNKDCVKVTCNIELLETASISNKCVPVYHQDVCCPYDWRCPSKDDAIIPSEERKPENKHLKCKFGKLEFEIGDALSTGTGECQKCFCKTPPMLDCIFTPGC